jgi:glycosyltransferase involved in cell wall biosynthesis
MLKTMEYMAMGKPIVSFDLPETRYTAQDAALYAASNSVSAFADCIEKLLEDATLREQMGQSGRRRIEEELCWDRTREELFRAYASLLPKSPARNLQAE